MERVAFARYDLDVRLLLGLLFAKDCLNWYDQRLSVRARRRRLVKLMVTVPLYATDGGKIIRAVWSVSPAVSGYYCRCCPSVLQTAVNLDPAWR